MKGVPYEQRCERLGLSNLSDRRLRGDMITAYKQARGFEEVVWCREPMRVAPRAGKREQLRRERVSLRARHGFFTNRVAGPWNALPDEVVAARSVDKFKAMYDRHTASKEQAAAHSPSSTVDGFRRSQPLM